MDCWDCQNKPSFLCHCKSIYLCDIHVVNHLKLNIKHDLQNLEKIFDSDEKTLLDKELNSRIKSLKSLKQEITKNTEHLIKTIKSKNTKVLQRINMTIKNYQKYKEFNNFEISNKEEIKSLLNSKLTINYFNSLKVEEEMKKFYSNNFYEIITDNLQYSKISKLKFLENHSSTYNCLVVSNDGRILATGSHDSCIRFWDLQNKTLISCLINHKSCVNSLSLSLDNTLLVSGSQDKSIILWNFAERSLKKVFLGHSGSVSTVLFTNDSKFIISGSFQKEVIFWDIDSNTLLKRIIVENLVYCGIIKKSDFFLLGIGFAFEVWDFKSFSSIFSTRVPSTTAILSIEVTNDCEIVALAADKDVIIYSINKNNPLAKLSGHSESINSISITEDDKYLVSGSLDSCIILWSLQSKSKIHEFSFHINSIFHVKTYKDFIFSSSNDNRIGITRISTLTLESFLTLPEINSKTQYIRNNLAAYGLLKDLFICDSNNNEYILKGHFEYILSCCISPSMNLLISSSKEIKNNLIIWNLKTFTMICALKGHQNSVTCTDISYNEIYAISGDGKGIIIFWNLLKYSQEFIGKQHQNEVKCVKFCKSSKFAASGGVDGRFLIWDIKNKLLSGSTQQNGFYIRKVWISDDDKYFLYQIHYHYMFIWNIDEKRIEKVLKNQNEKDCWISQYRELESEVLLDF